MPKDLTTYVQNVWQSRGLEAKRVAMIDLINASHAKNETKRLYIKKAELERNPNKLDTLASNYAMSGEGLKVQ